MKLRPFLVPALLLTVSSGVVAWLLLAEPPEAPESQIADALRPGLAETTDVISEPEIPTEGKLSSDDPAATAAPLPVDIRNVSPDGVSAPQVSGGLKRIEPSKRFQELVNPPVEPVPDGPLELIRVQVLDGGRIKSKKLVVTLAHIEPMKIDETCIAQQGGVWPCGTRARTFLRGLIRQFKITCEKIAETGPQEILATCKRGKIDLSTRLVRYGWADPAPGAPEGFQDFALLAKQRKLGKWQDQWQFATPDSRWDADPNAPLPGLEDLEPEIVEWSQRTESADPNQEFFGFEPDVAEDIPQQ
ncbi:MAG: thermonuclease family protein [Roseibium album]|uniref:thermonuclease family protein n=1 Tax=Roseibium album TaxID=311410 RepID=UPI0018C9197D|nr:endonuclease YncB(thermonuclease family) [Labrenzia sp. EL_162]MBG6192646.1 endonuclease YncB(thermonuclease family) [Labrenzia sp. EL_159]